MDAKTRLMIFKWTWFLVQSPKTDFGADIEILYKKNTNFLNFLSTSLLICYWLQMTVSWEMLINFCYTTIFTGNSNGHLSRSFKKEFYKNQRGGAYIKTIDNKQFRCIS